jgi:hypothetical protein
MDFKGVTPQTEDVVTYRDHRPGVTVEFVGRQEPAPTSGQTIVVVTPEVCVTK